MHRSQKIYLDSVRHHTVQNFWKVLLKQYKLTQSFLRPLWSSIERSKHHRKTYPQMKFTQHCAPQLIVKNKKLNKPQNFKKSKTIDTMCIKFSKILYHHEFRHNNLLINPYLMHGKKLSCEIVGKVLKLTFVYPA